VVYFGSSKTTGYSNFIYAVNITNGDKIWQYNTSLPVNYVSHFTSSGSTYIVAGTGGSTSQLDKSYVIARWIAPTNKTLWQSVNLNSSVTTVSPVESNVTGSENVVAGLLNGTVFSLSGIDGSIQWRYNCNGTVTDIVNMQDGSIIVGSSQTFPIVSSHVYRFSKNGTLDWSVPFDVPLTLVEKFGNTNNVVVVVPDGLIHVFNGLTGQENSPWPFNKTGGYVIDLLCTQDYTGDGFPDIVAGTDTGTLMIINGKTASLIKGPTPVSSFSLSSVQYMNFYEDGATYLNKTLAVSVEESDLTFDVCGVNASTLSIMKEYNTSSEALNLFNIGNFTSDFTGDLLFTVGNTVYCLQGTDIIVPEFAPNFILISLVISVWFLIPILRKRPQFK
jgi:hypothetical protein